MKNSPINEKLINILYSIPVIILSIFIRRDKKIFVFGDWFGKKKSDSSFYIYKIAYEDKSVQAIWITKSNKIYNELKKKKYRCFKALSIKGIYFQLKAFHFISTVNSFDFYPPALLIWKKNYIQLGHGMPFKKYFKNYLTYFQKILFKLRSISIDNYSYYASSSSIFNKVLKDQYNIQNSKILEIPPARVDYFDHYTKEDVLDLLNLNKSLKYIAYLPTHRNEGKSINEIYKNINILDDIINKLDANLKVIFKPHFYDINLFNQKKIKFKNIIYNPTWDSDSIMKISDLLIGDYSGVIFDYYYLNRFEICLCTDYNSYIQNHRELHFKIEDLYVNVANNKHELENYIQDFLNNRLKKMDSSKFLWNKNSLKLSYSEIAWKKIKKTIK